MSLQKESQKKVILLCINGASWNVILPLIKRGKLPHMSSLMKNGSYGSLNTITLPRKKEEFLEWADEPFQWASIATGVRPEKHGVMTFTDMSESFKVNPLWRLLSAEGKVIGILNWLTTYPPERINGFVVPGWAPEETIYPSDLQESLSKFKMKNIITKNLKSTNGFSPGYIDLQVKNEFEELERVSKYFSFLKKKYNPDLFMIGLFGADHLQHSLWKYYQPSFFDFSPEKINHGWIIPYYYERLDELIIKPIAKKKNITSFIVSDHGFAPKKPPTKVYFLLINKLLEEGGLLENWSKIDFSSTKVYLPFDGIHIRYNPINLPHFDVDVTYLYVNLEGREKNGIVKKEEFERVRNKTVKFFSNIKVQGFESFFLVEKVNKKSPLKKGGDIRITVNVKEFERIAKYLNEVSIQIGGTSFPLRDFFQIYEHSGEHTNEGIIIANGPDIKENVMIKDRSILDLTPTILHMFNLPIPSYVDGKVMMEIFREDDSCYYFL